MGILFNRKKANNEQQVANRQTNEYQNGYGRFNDGFTGVDSNPSVHYRQLENGFLEIERYDDSTSFKQFYDMTRLIIDKQPVNIGNQQLRRCFISWYGREDVEYFDQDVQKLKARKEHFREILVGLDVNELINNPQYSKAVMTDLLNQSRVERYLNAALEERPQTECGNYVGEIRRSGNEYKKYFIGEIGKYVHNLPQMVQKREKHRQTQEMRKQRQRAEYESQIADLNNKINEL